MEKIERNVRDVALVGLAALSLSVCAPKNIQRGEFDNNYAETKKDSVNCTIISMEGEPDVLYVEEVPPLDEDRSIKTYYDIRVNDRLDLVMGGFLKDEHGDSGKALSAKIREGLKRTGRYEGRLTRVPDDYLLMDDSDDSIPPSSFYYDSNAKRIQRGTKMAQGLQREFEDLKTRCKATEIIEIH